MRKRLAIYGMVHGKSRRVKMYGQVEAYMEL